MKKVLHTLAAILISVISYAQVGIGTSNPDNSAMLQVASSEKGFLLPQMTSTQRTAVSNPANGLQIYDTTTNSIWFFNGSFWVNTQAMATVGDVKSGLQTNDHSGWVLLDGRSIGNLSTNQQAAASALGLSGTLPNAADAYLVQNGGSMGAISGSNTVTLTQANLPDVSFSGNAASAGAHTHTASSSAAGGHYHTGTTNPDGMHSHTGTTNAAGTHDHGSANINAPFLGGGLSGASAFIGTGSSYVQVYRTDFAPDHTHSFTTSSSVAHQHAFTTSNISNHTHTITVNSDGNHAHNVTVSSGGSATPVNVAPKSLSVNMFIYLGL